MRCNTVAPRYATSISESLASAAAASESWTRGHIASKQLLPEMTSPIIPRRCLAVDGPCQFHCCGCRGWGCSRVALRGTPRVFFFIAVIWAANMSSPLGDF